MLDKEHELIFHDNSALDSVFDILLMHPLGSAFFNESNVPQQQRSKKEHVMSGDLRKSQYGKR
jgi:hypothetical protein